MSLDATDGETRLDFSLDGVDEDVSTLAAGDEGASSLTAFNGDLKSLAAFDDDASSEPGFVVGREPPESPLLLPERRERVLVLAVSENILLDWGAGTSDREPRREVKDP